jgi:hypothetical protein
MRELSKRKEIRTPLSSILIFCILSIIIILTGYFFYEYREEKNKSEFYSNLSYISKLKVDEITNWRNERIIDASDIQKNPSLINDINDFFSSKQNLIVKSRIENWIKNLTANNNYANVYLLNSDLEIVLSANSQKFIDSAEINYIRNIRKYGKVFFTDLHRSSSNFRVNMDLIIPLVYPNTEHGNHIGLILITIDPGQTLFPLIKTWPSESKSAETLLIRRDKDSVVYLNELRGKQNTTLSYKLPLSQINVPAVHAALGYKGIFEGVDYRGIPVLSDIANIPGTNWMLISKMDIDEILAPLQKTILLIIAYGAIVILSVGTLLVLKWKSQQSKFY